MSHWEPVVHPIVFLEQLAANLAPTRIRADHEQSSVLRKCDNPRGNHPPFQRFEFFKFLLGWVIDVGIVVFTGHVRQRTCNFCESLHEMAVDVSYSEERAQLRELPRELERLEAVCRCFRDTELIWGNDVTQVVHLRLKKATLLELEGYSGTPQQAHDSIYIRGVFFLRTGEHNHVIMVDETDLPSDARENNVQRTLESFWCPF